MTAKRKRKPERFPLRVVKGGFQPADGYVQTKLRSKGYRVGDVVMARLVKCRSPGFHRLAHRFATLVVNNIDEFHGMDAHACLKRLQWESGIGCETMGARVPGVGFVEIRIPISLAFDSMEEGEFRELFRGLARHIAETYWPDLSPKQVETMAEAMPEEV